MSETFVFHEFPVLMQVKITCVIKFIRNVLYFSERVLHGVQ